MSSVIKFVVCGFSFAFTAYFTTLLLYVLAAPLAGAVAFDGHSFIAALITIVPLLLSIPAGIQAGRVALRLERQRQSKARPGKPTAFE